MGKAYKLPLSKNEQYAFNNTMFQTNVITDNVTTSDGEVISAVEGNAAAARKLSEEIHL